MAPAHVLDVLPFRPSRCPLIPRISFFGASCSTAAYDGLHTCAMACKDTSADRHREVGTERRARQSPWAVSARAALVT